jgi:ligand-binding sensor domain-containing protein
MPVLNNNPMKNLLLLGFILFSVIVFGQNPTFLAIGALPKPISTINCIAVESDSVAWVGTNAGLVRLVKDTFQVFYDTTDRGKFKINKIVIDKEGKKWLGTYRSSIVCFKNIGDCPEYSFKEISNNKFQLVTSLNFLKNQIWIGTSEGLALVFDSVTKKFKNTYSPVNNEIYSILPDETQGNWIGTAEGLFLNYKENKWKKVSEIAKSYGIYKNGEDYWTIGRDVHNQSVLLYNEQFFLSVLFMMNISKQQWQRMIFNGMSNDYLKMNAMAFDNTGFMWVATDDGFIHYDPVTGNGQQYTNSKYPELKIKEIVNIAIQNKNTIWLSSTGKDLIKVSLSK